jgi:hypothetical protein
MEKLKKGKLHTDTKPSRQARDMKVEFHMF